METKTKDEPKVAPATGPGAPPRRLVEQREEQRFTLDKAFWFNQNTSRNTFDLEKAIRSVAYLLDWHSAVGNEPVPGMVAQGMSETLNRCAEELRYLFTWDDIFALGGNPSDVLDAKEAAGHALPRRRK